MSCRLSYERKSRREALIGPVSGAASASRFAATSAAEGVAPISAAIRCAVSCSAAPVRRTAATAWRTAVEVTTAGSSTRATPTR